MAPRLHPHDPQNANFKDLTPHIPISPLRQERYRKFFQEVIPEGEWKLIRERVNRGGITGSEKFREEVEKVLGRRVIIRPVGRPGRK